ncbi:MAG: nucleotidyltransferase domain-containing protein [Ardenticatenaceae bacterium]
MTQHEAPPHLTPEEAFLWHCANTWRDPLVPADSHRLGWAKVVGMARKNRMQTMLYGYLQGTNLLEQLPEMARTALEADVATLKRNASQMAAYLARYLRAAGARGLETVVLKGLAVSLNVYGNAAMRPGGDIDILVRKGAVEKSLEILDGMGVGPFWPNLLDDRYYERHHLHQQRCTPDLQVWFEVHWALDHPLTLLTVGYDAMLDRTTRGTLLGEPVDDLSTPDLILALALHLVKHALYLPGTVERPDLARIILADGMLMYFVDVAEIIKQRANEIAWPLVVELARDWGAVDVLGSVLRICHRCLRAPVPPSVLDALPVRGPGPVTRWMMQRVVEYELATHLGQAPSRLWEFLLVTNGAFILRPIRLLDLTSYCFPNRSYLRRRYGSDSPVLAGRHLLRAAGQYTRLGMDTLYFTLERYRRLKALRQSASLFNRLDTGG